MAGELVTTVSDRSAGMICANRRVVLPASIRMAPVSGSSASAALRWLLFPGHDLVALGKSRLERESLDGDRSAMNPPELAGSLQRLEVAADGFGGDLESMGQRVDVDASFAARLSQDRLLAFLGKHATSLNSPSA